jgi:hypothetical protein
MPDDADRVAWYYQPLWIGVLTLAVLGPFALPLVWRSPALGPRGRSIGIALILLYTVAIFASTAVVVNEALEHYR